MQLSELCDVCGLEVRGDEAQRAEMTTDELMCPTSMTFHPACFQQAALVWHVDPEPSCSIDPDYPETGRWT